MATPGTAAAANERPYTLSDREFASICDLVREFTGISLSDAKRDLVYSRFSKRLRALGLHSFSDYCRLVESGALDEREQFVNAITTNLTAFFRESYHFGYLAEHVLPEIRSRRSRRLRIWSAGCSTGEEPYSIAMTLCENWVNSAGWDAKILATDLDSQVVAHAAAGRYRGRALEGLSKQALKRWFAHDAGEPDGGVQIKAQLRNLITFRQLNLMDPWPMHGPFQVIFCRNTVIYFSKATQRMLFERFAELQEVGDYLFIGHSETLTGASDRYRLVARTVYRKER